jgi:hypothetical protein
MFGWEAGGLAGRDEACRVAGFVRPLAFLRTIGRHYDAFMHRNEIYSLRWGCIFFKAMRSA